MLDFGIRCGASRPSTRVWILGFTQGGCLYEGMYVCIGLVFIACTLDEKLWKRRRDRVIHMFHL